MLLPRGGPSHHSPVGWALGGRIPSEPATLEVAHDTMHLCDVARSPDGFIGLSDDHHRPPHVMNNGLRDASQEKAAERPEPSGSENDEVDIAVARGPRDLPRRIAFAHQLLDRTTSIREDRSRVGHHDVRVCPVRNRCCCPVKTRDRGRTHVHKGDRGVARESEGRHEAERRPRAVRTVNGHQNAFDSAQSTSDYRDGTGRVPSDGQRRASNQLSLEASETARSNRDHVHPHLLCHMDDLHLGVAQGDDRLDLGAPWPKNLRRPVANLASVCNHAFSQLIHGLSIARWLRECRHCQHGHLGVRWQREIP
jgi:hypothetical protein